MKKDIFHEVVKIALEKDGWIVTNDPLTIRWEKGVFYPDLGAEKILIAEKETKKIAVEIKSFAGQGFRADFYEALGQYDNYFFALSEVEPDRRLILAVPLFAYETFFQADYVQRILDLKNVSLLVYNTDNQTITTWIR
jgi:XisH protein